VSPALYAHGHPVGLRDYVFKTDAPLRRSGALPGEEPLQLILACRSAMPHMVRRHQFIRERDVAAIVRILDIPPHKLLVRRRRCAHGLRLDSVGSLLVKLTRQGEHPR
jgi:hypothetical protein